VVAALTGTDLYRDLGWSRGAQEVLEVSDRLVALQPLALDEIPRRYHWKTHVILQSVPKPVGTVPRSRRTFDACVLGHLRAVKDPFRAAAASRQLPPDSRVRIVQVGGAHTPAMERRAREEARRNPCYRWLGELPRSRALRALRRSRVMVISSRMEGGPNAISESLVSGVPVLASAIPGNVGLLGKGYPGYFRVGDSRALARLLRRVEIEPAFLQRLESWCRRRARAFAPLHEASAWRALLRELTRRS
jgi:putative glycosyltransferase (TIGR04348 family)